MGVLPGDKRQVHHLNDNPKDNRRCNLRIVTASENNRFKGPAKNNSTGLKGVYKLRSGRYRAQISERMDGKSNKKCLGTYVTEKEAGLAYDRAALARFAGAFLNFPDHVHQSIVTSLA